MNNLNGSITSNGNLQNMNANIMNTMTVNNQMAQIQQQMQLQQWQLSNATNAQQGILSPPSYYQQMYPYFNHQKVME